jgi:GcrA cell cycle regulator
MTLWTDKNTELCKLLFAEGKSAREIGNHFGISRNAACGKLSRLGLFRKQQRAGSPKPALKPRLRITKANTNSNGKRVSIVHEPASFAALRVVDIEPRGVSLLDLRSNGCRYPDGDPATFCDHPRMPDSSYCAPHHWLCRKQA